MSRKTDTVVASTIGIDTGKNTLHLIGLDNRGDSSCVPKGERSRAMVSIGDQ